MQKMIHLLLSGPYNTFRKDLKNPHQAGRRILIDILKRNRKTWIGKRYDFSSIKTVNQFKTRLPLTMYSHYEEAIERMIAGKKNILTSDALHSFCLSSGTTGKSKMIPATKKSFFVMGKRMAVAGLYSIATFFPGVVKKGGGVMLSNGVPTQRTRQGIPIGAATTNVKRKGLLSSFMPVPPEISALSDHKMALHLYLLFSLKAKNLRFIGSTFASSLFDFFRYLENNKTMIIEELRSGIIAPQMALEPSLKKNLERKLGSNRERAEEIERELAKGIEGIALRLWPKLECIIGVTTGPFKIYKEAIEVYTRGLPIYSPLYGASEGMFGINLDPSKDYYTLVPGTVFYEFIPANETDREDAETLLVDELIPGQDYELVITNYSGFYRYRMEDIIRVIDYHEGSPVIEYRYRKGMLLSVAGEKTPEDGVIAAMKDVSAIEKYIDFTTTAAIDTQQGFYRFFIEFEKNLLTEEDVETFRAALEAALLEKNPRYKAAREKNKIGPCQVAPLREGTFQAYKEAAIEKGSSNNQVKIPRVITSEKLLNFFQQNVLLNESLKG